MHAVVMALMSFQATANVDAWPAFLGAGGTPVEASTLPLEWSPVKNLAWRCNLPGQGQSSPVIWGKQVFVTSIEGPMKDTCHVVSLNLADGRILWDHKAPSANKVRSNYFQSRSAPTPVVDAQRVYAFFETGNLIALTHEGNQVWHRNLVRDLGAFESTIGLAASLTQTADTVFVLVDHEGPSYLLALDKATGKTRWKSDRDSRVSYASPAIVSVGGKPQVVCSSAGSVDGYDPSNGKLLWSFTEVGANNSATPVPFGPGRFLIGATPGMHNEREKEARDSNLALTVKAEGSGFAPTVAWKVPTMPSFGSPVVYRGVAYWVNKVGVVVAYDAETGKELYSKRTRQPVWATPVGVGDRVYLFGKNGLTTVLRAGPKFEVLAENSLWEQQAESPRPEGQRTGKPNRKGQERPEKGPGGQMFADGVQYGVALVPGHIVVRGGSTVYCLRGPVK